MTQPNEPRRRGFPPLSSVGITTEKSGTEAAHPAASPRTEKPLTQNLNIPNMPSNPQAPTEPSAGTQPTVAAAGQPAATSTAPAAGAQAPASTPPQAKTLVTNQELENMGLGSTTPPPQPPETDESEMDLEDQDPGSAEVRIDQTIRYRIKDPFKALSFGGIEQIERTIVAYSTSLTRAIASRVEMDPLIAQKTKIGKCIHEAFAKNDAGGQMAAVKPAIQPWMSFIACLAFVLVFVLAVPAVTDWGVFPTITLMATMTAIAMIGWQKIDTGHAGVLTILGRRIESLGVSNAVADEGYHWCLPFMDYIAVDMREKTIPNKDIIVIAGNAEDAGSEIPHDISEAIDNTYGPESGADVLAVITEEVMPTNKAIIEAREALKIEIGKSKAQDMDMRRQAQRAKNLITLLGQHGLDAKEALRAVQAQEGDISRDELIVTIDSKGKADEVIGLLVAAAQKAGIKLPGSGGGGGGGKNKNRHNQNRNRNQNRQQQGGRP